MKKNAGFQTGQSGLECLTAVFKLCPCCQRKWSDREEFLADPGLEVVGYQADLEFLEEGLFYFNHRISGCGSTIVIGVSCFLDLYSGPRYTERQTLLEGCPRFCIDKNQLTRCDAVCECAFVREVLQIVKARLAAASVLSCA